MKRMPSLVLACSLVGAVDASAQFKQLAGPPSEIGAMAPADPILSATHSKSALLAVQLDRDAQGHWVWHSAIPLEAETLRFAVFSGNSTGTANSWNVTIDDPITGRVRSAVASAAGPRATSLGLSGNGLPAEYYEFRDMPKGTVQEISIESGVPGQGFVLVGGAGPARLLSHQATFNQRVGQRIALVANIYEGDTSAVTPGAGSVSAALLTVTTPDGRLLSNPMFDDGLHADGQAGDGVYGGDFLADRAGAFNAQVAFRGRDATGSEFVRTAEHLIPVVEESLSLQGLVAASRMISSHRLDIGLNVVALRATGHYRVFAEVWGSSASGVRDAIPVAWIGGMTTIQNGALRLGLDSRWIAKAGAQAPFELRNVRIEDPDYFVILSSAARMPLFMPSLPIVSARPDEIAVDEEMTMGPRPGSLGAGGSVEQDDPEDYAGGVGHKLLLVHGYCSENVWGLYAASDFSDEAIFSDLKANRSHDQFAQKILTFGNTWNSYAIVAHSQGGAASLHLYTYYWSGLDNAGPGRLIQSVGTPYRGTNVAGILASLFQHWVGCGSQYDLTYAGAAAWLAGIPSANRAKVNYSTTSFTDSFGVVDFCSAATDLVLTDPDDGVTEKAWGQLPGGVDQGHKTGWCHTTDMRDPAQFIDTARNASMNSLAAVGRPTVTTNAASGIGQTGATLNGTVNPSRASTTTSFEYGTTTAYGGSISAQTRTGTSLQAISASPALSCGTLYHFRARGMNSAGTNFGSDATFSTSACSVTPPTVTTNAASEIGQTSATLNGTVNPNGASTTTGFDYGTSTAYGSSISAQTRTGSSSQAISASPALSCGTLYHFRAKGMSSGGPNTGSDVTFSTSACASAGSLQFSASGYNVNEGGGAVSITVRRIGGSAGTVSATFATSDGTATAADYSPVTQSVSFGNGDTSSKAVIVSIVDDTSAESSETVNLSLTNVTGGATLGAPVTAVLTIVDNDTAPEGVIVLAAGLSNPSAIALDNDNVYWADYGSGTIKKTAKTGGSITTIAGGLSSASGLAVDRDYVYFGDGNVKKVSKNGGAVIPLTTGQSSVWGLTVDSSHVYWTDGNSGTVRSVPLNGGSVSILSSDAPSATGVVTSSGDVFWTEFNYPGAIRRVPVSGGTTTILANGSNTPGIATDGAHIYWTELNGSDTGKVRRVPVGGGSPVTLVNGLNHPWDVAVDGANAFWIEERMNGVLGQVSASGGESLVLASGLAESVALDVDASYVYWIERNGGGSGTGTLKKVAKGFTPPASADLSITKTAGSTVLAGGNLTYTIAATNNGPSDAATVSVTDTTPTNTTFVSFVAPAGWTVTTAPAVGGSGTITATRAAQTNGSTFSFTLVVNVASGTAPGTTISNTATLASGTPDSTPGNNSATATTTTTATGAFPLSVSRAGTGIGTVFSSPGGINCGSDCAEDFAAGTLVTLTWNLASGSTFGGWGGVCPDTSLACDVTMSQARSVTVTFNASQGAPLAPTGLVATSAGFTRIRLAWTAADGATSYTIKRSTTPGAETTVAFGVTATTYSDTVAKGQPYYYVVSAVNGVGESANSNEAGATTPTRLAPLDFDGDGKSDLTYIRPTTFSWHTRQSQAGFTTNAAVQWGLPGDVPAPGDYDGDGIVDSAVYRPSNGTWYARLSGSSSPAFTASFGLRTDIPVAGDYDGDGRADPAVYRPSTGTWHILKSSTGATTQIQWGLPGDVPVAADYDGDGLVDPAVFRPSSGTWYVLRSSTGLTMSATWSLGVSTDLPVPGDYDGDGRADPAVYRPSSGTWLRLASSAGYAAATPAQWGLAGDRPVPADFDGDGKIDPAVYRPSSGTWFALLSSTGFGSSFAVPWGQSDDVALPVVSARQARSEARRSSDVDGDGKADLTVFRPASGQWFTATSSSSYGSHQITQWGLPADVPVPGDYDGDGRADRAVFRPATGMWYVLTSSSSYASSFTVQWGLSTDTPVPGDYDGDGTTDLAVFRPATGQWFILTSSSAFAMFQVFQWGLPTDTPVASDYDGDGKTDPAVFRPASGTWYVLTSSSGFTASTATQWGLPTDTPAPGDYDGDGKSEPAIFRPATGQWYLLLSTTNLATSQVLQWGLSADLVVPGDYDGDGTTDLAVFRPATGVWYVRTSSTGYATSFSQQWGLAADLPILKR